MAKEKKVAAEPAETDILDVLGIGGDPGSSGKPAEKAAGKEPDESDRIATLLTTIEGLTGRVDQMQGDFMRLATGGAPVITTPEAPKMTEITLEGLPDQADDPEGFAKGLNSRVNETLKANMAALTAHQASEQAAVGAATARGDRLWEDFQESYFEKLEADLPDTITDVTPYVETAAKAVAARAVRGIADPVQKARMLDSLMYGTPTRFMEDVFKETERVLAPLRPAAGEGEGEKGPTPEEMAAAHRTGGIEGGAAGPKGKGAPGEEQTTLVQDIEKIQLATGFY